MKKFFGISKDNYEFEIYDLTTLITILNVSFILLGIWWAPLLGILNCLICIIANMFRKVHINNYITQIALIVLNIYFLM